jgi:hypothetical protein
MTKSQRIVVIIAAAVAVLMILFPPLQGRHLDVHGHTVPIMVGYGSIFERHRDYQTKDGLYLRTDLSVAWQRLATQLGAIAVLTLAGWSLCSRHEIKSRKA